jgi:hypothetical protein
LSKKKWVFELKKNGIFQPKNEFLSPLLSSDPLFFPYSDRLYRRFYQSNSSVCQVLFFFHRFLSYCFIFRIFFSVHSFSESSIFRSVFRPFFRPFFVHFRRFFAHCSPIFSAFFAHLSSEFTHSFSESLKFTVISHEFTRSFRLIHYFPRIPIDLIVDFTNQAGVCVEFGAHGSGSGVE